jgi:NDP-sugar pyrophosphorylase family protein
MNYKVCIPTAGIGSRLGSITKNLNKALVSLQNKPIISHIVEKFPKETEFVIPIGFKGELVRDYLSITYPERNFEFVEIFPYEGKESGLGLTLNSCVNFLQSPFIFCSCDTLILEDKIPEPSFNWIGYAKAIDLHQFRTVDIKDGITLKINEKGSHTADSFAYIGLAGIYDYTFFWKQMLQGGDEPIHTGEAFGLRRLLSNNSTVYAKPFTWLDTGNLVTLESTRSTLGENDEYNILEKESEAIWFANDKVIKYSNDINFIKNRVKRGELLQNYVPQIIDSKQNMYAYQKQAGVVFSKVANPELFEKLFDYFLTFWSPFHLNQTSLDEFQKNCFSFYKTKTLERVAEFFQKFNRKDQKQVINGTEVPGLEEIFQQINWDWLSHGKPCRFHGDLHFENILYNKSTNHFIFLDWRQDFGGHLEYGDIYYDLAKLKHGLIISHELITKNAFSVSDNNQNNIEYEFKRKIELTQCEEKLDELQIKNNFDPYRTDILTSLIFLNIAALHHYPYSLLLFYLGKSNLFKTLNKLTA